MTHWVLVRVSDSLSICESMYDSLSTSDSLSIYESIIVKYV